MCRVGGDRIEQLLEPADELVEDLLVDELRQPPWALLVDPHANQHALLLELGAAERDELIDDEIGPFAGRQDLEHGGHGAIDGNLVEGCAQGAAERAAQLAAAAVLAQRPRERAAEIAAHAHRVVAVLEPSAEPRRQVGAAQPALDGLANEKMIADEARQRAADLVLARRHDRGVRDR